MWVKTMIYISDDDDGGDNDVYDNDESDDRDDQIRCIRTAHVCEFTQIN